MEEIKKSINDLQSDYDFAFKISKKEDRDLSQLKSFIHYYKAFYKSVKIFIGSLELFVEGESFDWRPNETIPEDYYAL